MRSFFHSPVLGKEIKLRFRSFKSMLGVIFYLAAIGLMILAFIYMSTSGGPSYTFSSHQSRQMFMVLSFLQLGLVIFVTPGLTAGVISTERERQTLNILLTTTQTSTSIILSKLFSSICFLLLLVVGSMPLYSFVFLYGGVSPELLFYVLGIYILMMISFGAIGVMFSTIIRKTIVSIVITYSVALFLVAGTAFLFLFLQEIYYSPQNGTTIFPYIFAMLNPVIVLMNVFEPMRTDYWVQRTGISTPLWISYVGSYLVITLTCILISIKKLRPKVRK